MSSNLIGVFMRNAALTLMAAVFLALVPLAAHAEDKAADAKDFSDAQKAAIEDVVKNYLTQKHPEIVMEAVQELQKRQQEVSQAKSEEAVTSQHDKIYNSATTPVGGNPKGDVTVVEFFDYQCPYCKMAHKVVQDLLKNDKNVKFIYEEYPILGPASTTAAKAALASVKQDKYIKYHDALMDAPFSHNQRPADDDALVYKTAKDVGLDVEKLKKDMAEASNDKMIEDNINLGKEVGVNGTPMFIIGDKVYPGALQADALKKAVDDARAAKKKL
jgi:protein-disulfide isomerase